MNATAYFLGAQPRLPKLDYVGPINPRVIRVEKALSKFRRLASFQASSFFLLSNRGWRRIANEVRMPTSLRV